jgi:RNA polymerase sigma-70 factor (ECF subfamily)
MNQLSPEVFATGFTACSRTLWCVAAAIVGDPVLAEDVLQEAAVIALRKLDSFEPDTCFAAWMTQIVRYVALNHARHRSRYQPRAVDPVHLDQRVAADEPDTPLELTDSGQLRLVDVEQAGLDDELLAALHLLDENARACLLLRVVMELPYREISRTLGIPEGTAMSHVHRARRALHEQLTARTPSRIDS